MTMLGWVKRKLCGLFQQHDYFKAVRGKRMFLICSRCLNETPGWNVGEEKPC